MRTIFSLLFVFVSTVGASGVVTIAVNLLTPNGVTSNEASSLTDALRSELNRTGKYQVLERSQMDEILKEQGFQQSGACDEATCAMEIGKILSVSYIALGSVGLVGKTYSVNVRIVNVGTGKILKDITEYHKGSIDELLTKVIPIVVQRITGSYVAKKRNHTAFWIAAGSAVAIGVAIPIIIVAGKGQKSDDSSTDLTIKW